MTTRPRTETMYEGETPPPWDIGKPQESFIRLVKEGKIQGPVLDIGCGTGELAIYLTAHGRIASGIDLSATAIAKAREKLAECDAKEPNVYRRSAFVVGDIFEAHGRFLQNYWESIVDCGVFHQFDDHMRAEYVEIIHSLLRREGSYYALVWSDKEPPRPGPRHISKAEIRQAFSGDRWQIAQITDEVFQNRENTAQAYMLEVIKIK